MSSRVRPLRKSTGRVASYADPLTSVEEDGDASGLDGGGGRNRGSGGGPSKRAKRRGKAVEVDEDEDGDEDEPPRKKARTFKKGVKKGHKKAEGKLEIVKTLPVELLTEIFSHLEPDDLIAVSMVNKQYRALLTAKSSGWLWKAARDSVGMRDASAGGLTEWQYAYLVYGGCCSFCGTTKSVETYVALRMHLCRRCVAERLVDVHGLARTHPRLLVHPRAYLCIRRTPSLHWGASFAEPNPAYGLFDELLNYSAILFDLEAEDEASDTALSALCSSWTAKGPSSSSSGPRSRAALRKKNYREKDSDDEGGLEYARRVDDFVAQREQILEPIRTDGRALTTAMHKARARQRARRAEAEAEAESQAWERRMSVWLDSEKRDVRVAAIKERVLGLDLAFEEDDFNGAWTTDPLVNNAKPLDDGEWTLIKPKVLKLLHRLRKKRLQDELVNHQQTRQISLRHRYDTLKASLPARARPFVPLFLDFLLLPSVKALWEPADAILNRAAWTAQLDSIKEELEQHRLDLVLHTRQLIIAATTEPEERTEDGDADELDLSDALFQRATSFVCCSVKGCFSSQNGKYVHDASGSWSHTPSPQKKRDGAIGSLARVLQYQHDHHNDEGDYIKQPRRFADEVLFRVELPLEIACAMSAVLDLLDVDPLSATRDDLEHADRDVWHFEWLNSPAKKRRCWRWGPSAWASLLDFVKYQGDKRAAMKPPLPLDPPCLLLRPVR